MKKLILIFSFLFFMGCGPELPGVKPPFEIYPYEFYKRFNLRTILSSYDGALRFYCASYPKDFFRADQLYMPDMQSIVIENEKRQLRFELYDADKVIVTDEVLDGSYHAKYLYKVYYNEEHDDFRTDRFFIEKPEDCKPYPLEPKEETISKENL